MFENKCCGNCEHFCPNSNIDDNYGFCKELEVLVDYIENSCSWFCKRLVGDDK